MINFENASKNKKQIKNLYNEAFPKEERIFLPLLYFLARKDKNAFNAVKYNGDFIGLVYTVKSEALLYVFFLAIDKNERGKGFGTKVLQKLKNIYPNLPVTLLIEDCSDTSAPNYDMRQKRLSFYESNGFKRTNIKVNEAGVDFELLSTDENITKKHFLKMLENYFGKVIFRHLYKNNQTGKIKIKEDV